MSLARQHIKPATFDDGTEATANRDIADNLFENDILLTLPQAKAILEEVKTCTHIFSVLFYFCI